MAKKAPAQHSGGAWKVAYADFVTAMMALFMVLWISAQDKKILLSTSHYFQDPFQATKERHSGFKPVQKAKEGTENDSGANSKQSDPTQQLDLAFLNSVAKELYRFLNLEDSDRDQPIHIQVSSDGLRVTLFDRARRPLFASNTAEFTEWGKFVIQNLAWLVEQHHFYVVIEGYTRTELKFDRKDYSAWELSADRANAARRALSYYAVDPKHIERVTGYGDTRPVPDSDPASDSNQRVAISLSVGHRTHHQTEDPLLRDALSLSPP
jgi:chemotaxis protein MotB